MSSLDFRTQQRSFDVLGYAHNPSLLNSHSNPYTGDVHTAFKNEGALLGQPNVGGMTRKQVKEWKRKRENKGDFDFDEHEEGEEEGEKGEGSDAPKKKKKKEYVGPWAGWENERVGVEVQPTEEEWEEQEVLSTVVRTDGKSKVRNVQPGGEPKREIGFGEEKSTFHGWFMRSTDDMVITDALV
jgi:pre-mRNA-processing factor 17